MTDRFLLYSLERGKKICVVYSENGVIRKKNLLVLSVDEDGKGFSAMISGKKEPVHIAEEQMLTASYARGDHGELED